MAKARSILAATARIGTPVNVFLTVTVTFNLHGR
jgi:hypothetical protein